MCAVRVIVLITRGWPARYAWSTFIVIRHYETCPYVCVRDMRHVHMSAKTIMRHVHVSAKTIMRHVHVSEHHVNLQYIWEPVWATSHLLNTYITLTSCYVECWNSSFVWRSRERVSCAVTAWVALMSSSTTGLALTHGSYFVLAYVVGLFLVFAMYKLYIYNYIKHNFATGWKIGIIGYMFAVPLAL